MGINCSTITRITDGSCYIVKRTTPVGLLADPYAGSGATCRAAAWPSVPVNQET